MGLTERTEKNTHLGTTE